MEHAIEVSLQFLFEFLLQVAAIAVIEAALRVIGEPFDPDDPRGSFRSVILYIVLGLVSGGITIGIFSNSFIHDAKLRPWSLLVGPACAGLLMWAFGKLRERRFETRIRLDSLPYGFLFAFGIAAVRFVFAR